ncbi:hypothetical protein G6011_00011 [Alternaria panax]|uniref:C2H2-type domain-containing protein n=1 Tax=Alternaria panax TaxID=48097 RepID=A0AAD4F7Z7_9PLEO|nr:hypothetical protein G6011_00011 [Alternaria panax]
MEHHDSVSVISSPNQTATDSSATQDHTGWDTYGPVFLQTDHRSTTESPEHYDCDPSPALLFNISTDTVDPWILEEPPYGSPLSTSSVGHTESVGTPFYTDMPICFTVTSPVFQHVQSPPRSIAWSDEQGSCWKLSHPEPSTWGPQEPPLPHQRRSACDQELMQCIRDYIFRYGPLSAPNCIPYQTPVSYSAAVVVDSAAPKLNLAVSPDVSEQGSDSDSRDSDYEDDASSREMSNSPTRQRGARSNVMKFGMWGRITYPFCKIIERRQYWCPLMDKKDPQIPCAKTFQRPEHLQRHVITVHGEDKCHLCKVCPRLFSRRDNLREHYWTHLTRGGRAGKNTKMSLPELKAILGPKEKLLVRRLKRKLLNHQARQAKGKP